SAHMTREKRQRKQHAPDHAIPRSHSENFFTLRYSNRSARGTIASHSIAVGLRTSLGSLGGFCGCEVSGAMIFASFAKKLADHLFHGHFLNVNVAYIAFFEQFTTGFGDFRARNFQLDRSEEHTS